MLAARGERLRGADRRRAAARRARDLRSKDGRRVAEPKLKLLTGSRDAARSHESRVVAPGRPRTAGGRRHRADEDWHPFLTRLAMAAGRPPCPAGRPERRAARLGDDRLRGARLQRRSALSTPILSDRLVANAGGRRILPLARRNFDATSVLHAWFELDGAARRLRTRRAPRANAASLCARPTAASGRAAPPTAMSALEGRPTRLVSIPLAERPDGRARARPAREGRGVRARRSRRASRFEVTRAR